MQMQWFLMYAEARNDAKLRSLTDAQHRVWFNLLCYASQQTKRGTIECESEELLALEVASGDTTLLESTCARLEALRIIDRVKRDETHETRSGVSSRFIAFINFEKRQHPSVSRNANPSTERVRKYRARKQMGKGETHETFHETPETHETPKGKGRKGKDKEETPPNPPEGGGVGVSKSASLPDADPEIDAPVWPALAVVSAAADEPFVAPHADKTPAITGPGRDSVEAKALEKWAERFERDHEGESYAYWARQKCDGAPSTWLKAIIEEFVEGRSGTHRKSTRYLNGVLRRCLSAGACSLVAKHSGPASAPSRPTNPIQFVTAPREFVERGGYLKGHA